MTPLVVAWYGATAIAALGTGAILVVRGHGLALGLGFLCLSGGGIEAIWTVLFDRRAGVGVDAGGVTVCNGLARHRFAWSEVQAFAFGRDVAALTRWQRLNGHVLQTYLVTRDGRHQVMEAMRSLRTAESRAQVQGLLDSLEGLRPSGVELSGE